MSCNNIYIWITERIAQRLNKEETKHVAMFF